MCHIWLVNWRIRLFGYNLWVERLWYLARYMSFVSLRLFGYNLWVERLWYLARYMSFVSPKRNLHNYHNYFVLWLRGWCELILVMQDNMTLVLMSGAAVNLPLIHLCNCWSQRVRLSFAGSWQMLILCFLLRLFQPIFLSTGLKIFPVKLFLKTLKMKNLTW